MGMRHIDSLNGYYLANDHITTQLRVCVCVWLCGGSTVHGEW